MASRLPLLHRMEARAVVRGNTTKTVNVQVGTAGVKLEMHLLSPALSSAQYLFSDVSRRCDTWERRHP